MTNLWKSRGRCPSCGEFNGDFHKVGCVSIPEKDAKLTPIYWETLERLKTQGGKALGFNDDGTVGNA